MKRTKQSDAALVRMAMNHVLMRDFDRDTAKLTAELMLANGEVSMDGCMRCMQPARLAQAVATKLSSTGCHYQDLKNGLVKPESLTEECIAAGTEWM